MDSREWILSRGNSPFLPFQGERLEEGVSFGPARSIFTAIMGIISGNSDFSSPIDGRCCQPQQAPGEPKKFHFGLDTYRNL